MSGLRDTSRRGRRSKARPTGRRQPAVRTGSKLPTLAEIRAELRRRQTAKSRPSKARNLPYEIKILQIETNPAPQPGLPTSTIPQTCLS